MAVLSPILLLTFAGLWLAGSRFSQSLVTLAAVAVGAYLGKRLPVVLHWGVDPIGTCFAGALVMGVMGYLYYRLWTTCALSILLAGIGGWMVVVLMGGEINAGEIYNNPVAGWGAFPEGVRQVLPYVMAGCSLGGFLLAAFGPRLAERVFYSLLGVLLLSEMVGTGHAMLAVKVWVAAGLMIVGVVVQWLISPKLGAMAPGVGADVSDSKAF